MVVLAAYSNAQVTWRYAYGAFDNDRASVVRVVNEDLYFVAGSTGSFGAGASDIYLVALNALGVPQWSRTIGGIGVETAQDLIILADGGSMIVGSTSSQGAGGYDGYLVRTDANGDMLWERTFGGTDWDLLNDIKQVSEDRFLLTGQTYSNGQTAGSGWIMLVDATGEAVWSQAVLCGPGTNGYATASTDDGGFVCTGSISDPNEPSDAFVAKYDAAASLEWMYRYGGDSLDIGRDIVATMDGGYSIMGSTRSYSNWVEAYHLKMDKVWNSGTGIGARSMIKRRMSTLKPLKVDLLRSGIHEQLAEVGRICSFFSVVPTGLMTSGPLLVVRRTTPDLGSRY